MIFRQGCLAVAAGASVTVPNIYIPTTLHGRTPDGGLRKMCQTVKIYAGATIASHLSSVDYYEKPENVLDVMRNVLEIAVSQHTTTKVAMADLIIAMNLSILASEITPSASMNYFQ